MDRIQLQHVPPYVTFSNGALERRHSELVSQKRHALNGRVYMVYGASAAATASRHSRPSISAALTAFSKTCSFRRPPSGLWLTLERRSTSYGTPSSPPTFGPARMRFEVFKEWLRLLSARLFSMSLCLHMFRMRGGLLNISLQVTTTRGSCLMRGSRSSRSLL